MIWSKETFRGVRHLRYQHGVHLSDEAHPGHAEMLRICEGQTAALFARVVRERFGATIPRGDIETQIETVPGLVDPDTGEPLMRNETQYVIRARWSPATSEVLFQAGPLDGKMFTIEPTRLGREIVALEAPSPTPWFAIGGEELVVPVRVIYRLESWDDEMNVWIYRPEGY